MTRRLMTIATAAISLAAFFASAPPAAGTSSGGCAGEWGVSAPLRSGSVTAATPSAPDRTAFAWSLQIGICEPWDAGTAAGTISGWCDLFAIDGVTAAGHAVHGLGAGTVVAVTGQVFGTLSSADSTGGICTTNYLVGALAVSPCGYGVSPRWAGPPPWSPVSAELTPYPCT